MAAARPDYPPDQRGVTPHRQLLTVSELEDLFGPDATVELRGGRPEHVETDIEVIPPRRTSRWMAPVLLVVFGAASLLGYALLRSSAPVEAVHSVDSWSRWTTAPALGPTDEKPVEPAYVLPPFVAKISQPGPAGAPPAPVVATPTDEQRAAELDQTVPAPETAASPAVTPRISSAKPAPPPVTRAPAQRAVAPRASAVDPAREDEATRQLIEKQIERLEADPPASEPAPDDDGETYPPGYIEAEIR